MKTVVFAIVCMSLIGGGVVAGFLFALSTIQPVPTSGFPEYLLLSEPEYGDSGDWFAMTINNTGVGAVTLIKALVNNVKQSSTNPILPTVIAPDHGLVLNVTMNLNQSRTYQIDLYTARGNKFSKLSELPYGGHQGGVMIYKANISFYNQNGTLKINVDMGNSGTQSTTLTALYVGTSQTNMQNQTITPIPLPAGGTCRITVAYNWTKGATYFFKVLSSSGQTYEGPETAPAN